MTEEFWFKVCQNAGYPISEDCKKFYLEKIDASHLWKKLRGMDGIQGQVVDKDGIVVDGFSLDADSATAGQLRCIAMNLLWSSWNIEVPKEAGEVVERGKRHRMLLS